VKTSRLSDLADRVELAAQNLRGVVPETPLQFNQRLSELTGASVYLKREDLTPVRSYKLRGAYQLMSELNEDERKAGVVCASAGNHGQGVAFACGQLGIEGEIVVPTTTSRQKRERILTLGKDRVQLIVAGETYDAASHIAEETATTHGRTLVPAFDHPATMAGQGSVAQEIVHQLGKAPDVLVLPVGGGGLLAGCGAWMATHHPTTRIVGVEPAGAACVKAALEAGEPVHLPYIDTFVDGAAVGQAGTLTTEIITALQPEVMAIPEGQICSEILNLYQADGIIAEPAGALASASLRRGTRDTTLTVEPGQSVVCVLSGGNNDISRYSEVIERSLVFEGRKHYILVTFPQEPGALRRFLDDVLGPEDDIVLFEYTKKSNRETGPALVGIELGNPDDFPAFLERLAESPVAGEVVDPTSILYRYLV